LTVNGNFLVQGTFLAENSAVSVSGNVGIVSAGTIVNLGGSTWTVNGTWTNASTSSSWVAGTSTVTIADAGNATLTFPALNGAAGAYSTMGTSVWTVAGTWTNASTSASWSAGTSTVTFTSATGGTMTFAGSNLAGSEFYNVAFASSAASAQTFTMSTRGLNWGGTLTVSDASSSTQLATANLSLTGGGLVLGNGVILTANAS